MYPPNVNMETMSLESLRAFLEKIHGEEGFVQLHAVRLYQIATEALRRLEAIEPTTDLPRRDPNSIIEADNNTGEYRR